jgi:hypothetical protein
MSAAGAKVPRRETMLIAFTLFCAVFGDRAVVGVSTGGRGALGLVAVAAPLVAAATIMRLGSRQTLGFLARPAFVWAIAPFLLLSALLPVFGVMVYGFEARTLLAVTAMTSALSFMVIGAALSMSGSRAWSRWLFLAIVLQLLYAGGQAIYLAHGPGWQLFTPFHQWDLSLQGLYGELIQARGTGLYFNPNELGLWAATAVILAWTMSTPRFRGLGITLAAVTLLLSQSRGALVALLFALAVGGAWAVVLGRGGRSNAVRTLVTFGAAALVGAAVVLTIGPAQELLSRLGSLVNVVTKGPTADPNLAGRLDYWAAVLNLNLSYPFGTLGPPETILGTAVDSSWFRAFAQGSVPYVAALASLLVAPLAVRNSRFGRGLVLVAVLVAVAGLTQTPLDYPVIYLFWVLLGAGLQSSVVARTSVAATAGSPGYGAAPNQRDGLRGGHPSRDA